MLDNLKKITQRDNSDALGVAEKEYRQLGHDIEDIKVASDNISNVIFVGMGGSALFAEMAKDLFDMRSPFEIIKDYHLPNYADSDTLVIVSSFSGNTEEVLQALSEAERKECAVVAITSGGKLLSLAEEKNYPVVKLDKSIPQPRMAAFNGLKALCVVLASHKIIDQSAIDEVSSAEEWLKIKVKDWVPTVLEKDNLAKQLAMEMMGKSVVIYSGPKFNSAAYKWKISINENSKSLAWFGTYSEYNHNEFIGWTSHPIEKPYCIINLVSTIDGPKINKRIEISDQLLSGKRPSPMNVKIVGETHLKQLLWAINLGDFVSIYLALLNNVDPTPVKLVEKLKTKLV